MDVEQQALGLEDNAPCLLVSIHEINCCSFSLTCHLSIRVFFFFPIVVSECDFGVIEVEHSRRCVNSYTMMSLVLKDFELYKLNSRLGLRR